MVEKLKKILNTILRKPRAAVFSGKELPRNQRGLSDDWLFLEPGAFGQANFRNLFLQKALAELQQILIEPVIVFKSTFFFFRRQTSLQGIRRSGRSGLSMDYAKWLWKTPILWQVFIFDIGGQNDWFFTESPSWFNFLLWIAQGSLQDVRLVSMDGLKRSYWPSSISNSKLKFQENH